MAPEDLQHASREELIDRLLAADEQLRWFKQQPREPEGEDESGLRFDDSVPVRTIIVPNPELDGLPEGETTVGSEKVTHRLAAYEVIRICGGSSSAPTRASCPACRLRLRCCRRATRT